MQRPACAVFYRRVSGCSPRPACGKWQQVGTSCHNGYGHQTEGMHAVDPKYAHRLSNECNSAAASTAEVEQVDTFEVSVPLRTSGVEWKLHFEESSSKLLLEIDFPFHSRCS